MRTKFFTGAGDSGSSKVGKTELPKDDPIFWALGGLDTLNSWIGLCRVEAVKMNSRTIRGALDVPVILKEVQEVLFIAQAEVAAIGFGQKDNQKKVTEEKILSMERVMERIDAVVPPITKFIIPGGSELSARLDVARTVARRVEREVLWLKRTHEIDQPLLKFLNRLSSLLFALARYVNHMLEIRETHPTYKT
ncbi:cob(I)yrinic acid a,c-diamide adenosyltransferase [Candidatus Jorgensenbacteria bacterium]|nr:cob(I)yrinic acid a,c-diamide adenosyltransferase [Candidatus Jorgensenbacteria bacterium]